MAHSIACLAQPRRAFDEQAPDALSVLAVSRRKKNPSTIARSRSLASWAVRRVGLEVGGTLSGRLYKGSAGEPFRPGGKHRQSGSVPRPSELRAA
jgi:hypothetical protein